MTRLRQELRERDLRWKSQKGRRYEARPGTKQQRHTIRDRTPLSRLVGPLLILCALLAGLIAADYWSNYGKVYRGVEAGGIALGGETPEEARSTLQESRGTLEDVKLVGPEGEIFTVYKDELGVSYDADSILHRAYAVGRQGSILNRVGERAKATLGALQVSILMDYDREQLRNATSDVFGALAIEPVEAGFEVSDDEVYVTESRSGQKVDEERLFDDLETGLSKGQSEYTIPIITDEPELTTEEAESMKPTELLGSYRTNYAVVPDDGTREENLDISSNAVDGTFLAPGEVFSMNDHVSALDYNEAKVIVEGAETKADGGGLCQVTSTLYNAANFAGLDVIERTSHSAQLPYIRPGMDATVWWGEPGEADDLDMKFRNTTDGYLLLREYVADDGYVHAEIWGRPNDVDVEMYSEPTEVGENGSEWVTYQRVEKDGEVLFDGVLHKDTYGPLVDEHGRKIPPSEVPVAPVDP